MVSATVSQLSSFTCIRLHQRYRFQPRSYPFSRSRVLVSKSNDGYHTSISNSEMKRTASYTEDASPTQNGRSVKLDPAAPEPLPVKEESETVEGSAVTEQIRAAKIHDFCLGIPFGGLVLSGGLFSFIVSKNPATLLYGGGLLGLSVLSLKVWRTGKSSLPFMFGQAVLAAALLWKNIRAYSSVFYSSSFFFLYFLWVNYFPHS
ncbi:OLC1v1036666C1 [Oldenlandia corymbosa var. corymbosa]|uniref:OLC1v1036666C1 n=1 Tax=Oldenlandia corymbosa var. corymbosa TaxID=529605 RepID=A0AAV1CVU5_OLDCO|nr:OLC1v1036666C1 [Oldenlandia corymbosa var. corymbosa]